MGSTIIRTSPMQGYLSGDGPYKKEKYVAASPRSGGAKIQLVKHNKVKKSASELPEDVQKRRSSTVEQNRVQEARLVKVNSKLSILEEIDALDQRISSLSEEREKPWLSIRKRTAATDLLHKLRKKRIRLTENL